MISLVIVICVCVMSFLRTIAECFARFSHGLGVCLSVHLSVTPWHCIKTATPRITKSSLWAASRSLVYRDKILLLGAGVPFDREHQRWVPL